MTMTQTERAALADVLEPLGLPLAELATTARYKGDEPPLDTDLALALAARTAVLAQAVATAEFGAMRGLPAQGVSLDRNAAVYALCCGLFQSCYGQDMTMASGAAAPLSDFYLTRDGRWFHPMGTYPGLRDGALALLDCANTPAAIARAVAERDGPELEEAFAAANLAGAMVRSREEWTAHPQGVALAAAPLVTVEKIAEGDPEPLSAGAQPLSALRVLDFTHVIAGPILTRTLAEQGVDCLRISAPAHADPQAFLLETGWGKRAAYLDFNRPGDLERMRNLALSGDVFVQSWRPGAMADFGLTAEELAAGLPAGHPGLVHVSVDSWGRTGPWAGRKGFEQLAQSVTGVALEEGQGGKPRYVPTGLLADYLAAYLGATGTIVALMRRAREGGSYRVHVSLAKVTMWAQNLNGPGRRAAAPFPTAAGLPPSIECESPFGLLRHLAPFAQYSATPANWSRPPVPPGMHDARWLDGGVAA